MEEISAVPSEDSAQGREQKGVIPTYAKNGPGVTHRKSKIYKIPVLILAAATASCAAGPALMLTSPTEYQVFQRHTKNSGKVVISGRAGPQCDRVAARLSGDWTAVPLDRSSHTFRAELAAPAGGFYALSVRAYRGKTLLQETAVAHVGIGEVFVISGQSNSTNYGEERQQTRTRMVTTFSGEEWRLANDPQPGVQDSSNNGSFIPPFGDALYERLHVPIGVACVGHGATSVRQWLTKGERMRVEPSMVRFVIPAGPGEWASTGQLFDVMMQRIRQLGPQGFRALLWHQGESDSNQKPGHDIPGEEYGRMLREVIAASRREAGWNFPWFVAQVSYNRPDQPTCVPVREAQSRLWREGIALEGPDTDQLTGDNRQNQGKGVHFSDKGLKAHGKLWVDKVGAWLDGVVK